MKRIFIYLALLTIGLSLSSCTEEIDSPMSDIGTLTINLKSSDLETKTMEGVQELNENLIQTIHYFLYPNGGTGSNAVLAGSVNTNKQITESFTIPLDDNILNQLFPYPQTQCQVFLIVNLPTGVSVPQNTSINNLKTIALSASFTSKQDSFVMAGQGAATLADKTKNPVASGDIKVDRIAAKLTLNVNVIKSRTDNGTVWTPIPGKMEVALYNCVNNAKLSGDPAAATSYFNITERGFSVVEGNTEYESSCDPFYSYPFKWNPGTESEPYFMIMLPWASEGQPYQRCYYKVILNGTQLEKNNWYNIDLMLDVLGSFNEKEPTVVVNNATYYVVNWSTGINIGADIQGARYLVVEQEEYKVYNKETLTIPFNTSHDCEIVSVSCKYPNLKTGKNDTEDASNYSIAIENGNIINLTHGLNNNMLSDDFDFTPFTFVFTIRHKDNHTYTKEITVVQYPAIYGVAQANSNWKGTNYSNDQNNDQYGYMYVNGYQGYTGDSRPNGVDFFLSAGGLYNNTSPNMYVFTVTTTEGTNYVIGDPRDTEYTYDAGDARWSSSPAIYNGNANRELNYYYGTLIANARYTNATNQTGAIYADDAAAEAAEPTINMIAPKFRLASGYSVLYTNTTSMTMENLKKRCASYQEDGYPAGRWRMPTRAEFQFIMTQVNKENLPELYYSGNSYWCAHGIGTPQDDGSITMSYRGYATANNGYSVRCVYDEWYWENSETYRLPEEDKDTFTWGDMPREAFDLKTE